MNNPLLAVLVMIVIVIGGVLTQYLGTAKRLF
jgi:hypothetical protein